MKLQGAKYSQKGVSLYLTLIVMSLILAMVLGITSILVGEIGITKGLGDSLSAFYAADTGIEKVLYYDRKEVPTGGSRGLCNICASCADDVEDCADCDCDDGGGPCDIVTCANPCTCTFNTIFGERSFEINSDIGADGTIINSTGGYKETKRTIKTTY